MYFVYGIKIGDLVENFACPSDYFNELTLSWFKATKPLSGEVIAVNGPISTIETNCGRVIKTATINL